MNVFEISLAFCALCCVATTGAPVTRIDQRQEGDLNIQAELDKIVLLIMPSKSINILDIKGQGAFESYEDLLPFLGKDASHHPNAIHDVKYKLSPQSPPPPPEEVKIKTLSMAAAPELPKDEKKETSPPKFESGPKVEQKDTTKKPIEVRDTTPKKADGEPKTAADGGAQLQPKKAASKSDGRTYHTVHSASNRERVIAVSNQEGEQRKTATELPVTKIEKF